MPRKPTSVFVIVQDTTSMVTTTPGAPLTNLQVWQVALNDGETVKEACERTYQAHPVGSMVYAVEDTKVKSFRKSVVLDEVEEPVEPPPPEDPAPLPTGPD